MPERKVIPRPSSFADLCRGGYRHSPKLPCPGVGRRELGDNLCGARDADAGTSVRVAVIRVFINMISATVALIALHLGGTTTIPGLLLHSGGRAVLLPDQTR